MPLFSRCKFSSSSKAKESARRLRRMYKCPAFYEDRLTLHPYPRFFSLRSKPIVAAVVRNLDVQPHDLVLELGFGQGDGLRMVWDRIAAGNGKVFGLELSEAMLKEVEGNLVSKASIPGLTNRIILDRAIQAINLPYPDSYFDSIFHVNVFYFWHTHKMKTILKEIMRTLKPGKRLLCGMELKEMEGLDILGIVHEKEYDPMRYASFLEPAGFENVKMTYEKVNAYGELIDSDKLDSNSEETREVLMISAQKPEVFRIEQEPEEVWRQLEADIMNDLMMESAQNDNIAQPESIRSRYANLQNPSERREEKEIEGPKIRSDHPINRIEPPPFDGYYSENDADEELGSSNKKQKRER